MNRDKFRKCPNCGEKVEVDAVRCRHCHCFLESGLVEKTDPVQDEEEVIRVTPTLDVLQCPRCRASIEEGVRICGNCRAHISWKDGEPRLSPGFVIQQTGCALTSLGCLIPLLVFLVLFIYLLFAGC